jgi:hypothetical protein
MTFQRARKSSGTHGYVQRTQQPMLSFSQCSDSTLIKKLFKSMLSEGDLKKYN